MKVKLMLATVLSMSLMLGSCGKKDDAKPKQDTTNQNPADNDNPEQAKGMAAKIDGEAWSATEMHLTLSNGTFTLTGMGASETVLTLNANNVNQTGTYGQVQGTSGSYIAGYGADGKIWSSTMGGMASLTISKLDLANKKASGTFIINASPVNNATDVKNITEGAFTNVAIE